MSFKYRDRRNTLQVLYAKECVRDEDADLISLGVLLCLDGAKRGQATNPMANTLSRHLLAAQSLWLNQGNMKLYAQAFDAVRAMDKACRRPGALLSLTTTEYQSIRKSISYYLRSMTKIPVGQLERAHRMADKGLVEV